MNDAPTSRDSALPALLRRSRPLHRYVATWQTPTGPQFSIECAPSVRSARALAERRLGTRDELGDKVWTHATSVSVKFETGKHNIPLLEAALRDPILCCRGGDDSPRMFPGRDARVLAARLEDYLQCRVVAEKCDAIDGDHDWHQLRLPKQHHDAALAFIVGWTVGQSDGYDGLYGRPPYDEQRAEARRQLAELDARKEQGR